MLMLFRFGESENKKIDRKLTINFSERARPSKINNVSRESYIEFIDNYVQVNKHVLCTDKC